MEHAGEGHFTRYTLEEHTGYAALRSLLTAEFTDPTKICSLLNDAFLRADKAKSAPSDMGSLVFGVYHSPVNKSIITSLVHRDEEDKLHLGARLKEEWEMPANLAYPMVFQTAVFLELTRTLSSLLGLDWTLTSTKEPHGPVDVHLEVDLFTYRAIVTFAEVWKLRFGFFPSPVHELLSAYRADLEKKKAEKQVAGSSLEAGAKFEVKRSVTGIQYPVVAFCPACAKHLPAEKRSLCKGCRIAYYCDAECQKKDWHKLHKDECKKFKKVVAEADCNYCKEGKE